MAVRKAIHLKGGGALLLHHDGKKVYAPSKRYQEFRKQHLAFTQCRRKPQTGHNCFKLLTAIADYFTPETIVIDFVATS